VIDHRRRTPAPRPAQPPVPAAPAAAVDAPAAVDTAPAVAAPAGGLLALRLATAVAQRATDGAVLQRLRLTRLDTTLGGTTATTNWGRLAASVAAYDQAVLDGRSIIVRTELLDAAERLLRAGKALDTGFLGARHRDSRRTKRAAGQRLLLEINAERAALTAERAAAVAKFDAIGPEIWRQYIDLRRQHHGSAVFDQGLHGKPPEPGYLASMRSAHRLARDGLGERMTAQSYAEIQAASRAHSDDDAMAGWSSSTDRVNADRSTAGVDFEAQVRNAWATSATAPEAWEKVQALGLPMGDTFKLTTHPLTINFEFKYEGKSEEASRARIQKLFDDFYATLRTTGTPLREIARLHKNLEYMHAFKDANTRTNLVVLNKLLVECGYNPVVLDDPNQSYTQTIDEWEALLDRGVRRWRAIRRAPALGLTTEEMLQAFDAHEGTPARNALQAPAANAASLAGLDFTT
jgi:hypothetical protein